MKKLISYLLLLLVIIMNSSCKEELLTRNFIVPIDFSVSREKETITWYRETVKETILKKMNSHDRIVVLPIDHKSEVWGEEVFTVDFSRGDYSNEFAGLQGDEVAQNNLQDSVRSAIELFDKRFIAVQESRIQFSMGTDVFGALRESHKYLRTDCENIIIIFSDMLQASAKERIDFENRLNSENDIEAFLGLVEPIELSGVKVMILTGPQTNVTTKKYRAVKMFWEQYFQKCNAQLLGYSSGGVTQLEELVTQKK